MAMNSSIAMPCSSRYASIMDLFAEGVRQHQVYPVDAFRLDSIWYRIFICAGYGSTVGQRFLLRHTNLFYYHLCPVDWITSLCYTFLRDTYPSQRCKLKYWNFRLGFMAESLESGIQTMFHKKAEKEHHIAKTPFECKRGHLTIELPPIC